MTAVVESGLSVAGRRVRRVPVAAVVTAAAVGVLVVLPALLGDPLSPSGGLLEKPSGRHWVGTDDVGRDVLTRVLVGARATVLAALVVVAVAALIGIGLGLIAGLTRWTWLDTVLSRTFDALLALPSFLFALAIAAALGPSLQSVVIALAAVWWPSYARVTRAEVRRVMGQTHVEAATHSGATGFRRAVRYVLPGTVTPLVVMASFDVGGVILTMAGLQFMGLGTPAPAPELGGMMQRGLPYLFDAPWVSLAPGVAITLLAVASNLIGDALQPRHLRRRRLGVRR